MDGDTIETPRSYALTEAGHRADFKVEEIVEFLYAASKEISSSLPNLSSIYMEPLIKLPVKFKIKNEQSHPWWGKWTPWRISSISLTVPLS